MKKYVILFAVMLLTLPVGGLFQPAAALVEIPGGATIVSATLSIHVSGPNHNTVAVHQVDEGWTETGVTWNTKPAFSPDILGTFETDVYGWGSTDITALVQDWVDGVPNYGVLLKLEQISTTYSWYPSSESSSIQLRPKLDISFYTTNSEEITHVTIQRPGSEQDGVADAYISERFPDTNGGESLYLSTGMQDNFDKQTLLRFDFNVSIEEKASLGDFVWLDLNQNGIQDAGEPGFPGVVVNLFDCSNNAMGSTITDPDGNYLFNNLTPGCYLVQFEKPEGYDFSPKNSVGGGAAVDSDASPSGSTDEIVLNPGDNDLTWDAGLIQIPTSEMGDFVWEDLNANGTQETGEPGIAGVNVSLYDCSDNLIATATTDANGFYVFTGLDADDYYVVFNAPSGYQPSPIDVGADDMDSDADMTTGKTACTTLDLNESDRTWDAGFYRPASIGDLVWQDINSDGIQESGEPGIAAITVNLYNCENTLIATTTTDSSGHYLFNNLVPGDYYVMFDAPIGLFSPKDSGPDDVDSDADILTGKTVCTSLISGESDMTWDAGIIPESCALTVTKSCFVPSPPASEFKCDKPIDSLTMIWGGSQTIRIKAWKGAVGSTLLADIDNIVPDQAVTVNDYAGSPNDVYWEIFNAGTNNKIGESTFHLSCSDEDMNGPEDCGKNQGNGKNKSKDKKGKGKKCHDNGSDTALINDWILAGMVDDSSSFNCLADDSSEVVSECEILTPSQSECDGKLKAIEFKYVGGDCSATTNNQEGKCQCNGDAGANDGISIVMTKDADKVTVSPSKNIQLGDVISIVADKEIKAETQFKIVKNGKVLQTLNIHTSCSKPLRLGDRFGSMEVVAMLMKDGDYLSVGSEVDFTYTIKNEGDVPVENITVNDSILGVVPGSPIPLLQPGETKTLETTELITETTTSIVEVQGVTALGEECSATASSTVTVVEPPKPPAKKHDKHCKHGKHDKHDKHCK